MNLSDVLMCKWLVDVVSDVKDEMIKFAVKKDCCSDWYEDDIMSEVVKNVKDVLTAILKCSIDVINEVVEKVEDVLTAVFVCDEDAKFQI